MTPERRSRGRAGRPLVAAAAVGMAAAATPAAVWSAGADEPASPGPGVGHREINLPLPGPADKDDSTGGITAADLDGDGRADLMVTCRGHLAAVTSSGTLLWHKELAIVVGGQSESQGLPGHHGAGVSAGDTDGDGRTEVVYLTRDRVFHLVEGATGKALAEARPPVPRGAERWELALLADFRGTGRDADVLLQATNAGGYRTGRHLAAYALADLLAGKPPLWETDAFRPCAHNGARLADLDGDGRDEVLGETILSPRGELLVRAAPFKGHMDSVFVADVAPDREGLEVILLEEGSNHVQVLGLGGLLWRRHLRHQEPQNAVIGRFRAGSEAVFIWCRSRYNQHQKPFVFGPGGEVVKEYAMDDVAPPGWTASGVEVIHRIDWTGGDAQLACAKERHTSGDVALFEPLTGRFVHRFKNKADRVYVADVAGDWREEVIVLARDRLHLYENKGPNPRPGQPRLWSDRNYRRLKQAHNYYSP